MISLILKNKETTKACWLRLSSALLLYKKQIAGFIKQAKKLLFFKKKNSKAYIRNSLNSLSRSKAVSESSLRMHQQSVMLWSFKQNKWNCAGAKQLVVRNVSELGQSWNALAPFLTMNSTQDIWGSVVKFWRFNLISKWLSTSIFEAQECKWNLEANFV